MVSSPLLVVLLVPRLLLVSRRYRVVVIIFAFLFPWSRTRMSMRMIHQCQGRPATGADEEEQELDVRSDEEEMMTTSSSSSSSSAAAAPTIPEGITVGAYYYPWYAGDFHRGDGYVRRNLFPKQHTPRLGEYDDREISVIRQHLQWSRQANIRLWVCSWWGAETREDTTILQHILKHPDLQKVTTDHKIALFYETTGRIKESEGWEPHRVAGDIAYMCQNYFRNNNNEKHYYQIDDKPVLFVYLTRLLNVKKLERKNNNNNTTQVNVLSEVIRIMRETAWSSCKTELYIVGDQVFGQAPTPGTNYVPFDELDAVTNYDLYGNIDKTPYAGIDIVNRYYDQQNDWKVSANNASGVAYVPAVSPGYNDRGVRLEAGHIALSRRLSARDPEGSLLVAQLLRARYLVDEGADNLLLVNSFNEWHEDTQIEPCIGPTTTQPELYTSGLVYEGYDELYLDILRIGTLACGSSSSSSSSPSNCSEITEIQDWEFPFVDAFNGPEEVIPAVPEITNSTECLSDSSTSALPTQRFDDCPPGGIVIQHDASSFLCGGGGGGGGNSHHHHHDVLSPTLGSTVWRGDDSILHVVDRRSTYHGIQLDLSPMVHCMTPGELYSISLEVRVVREDERGMEKVLTDCASLGLHCLAIYTDFLPAAPGADGSSSSSSSTGMMIRTIQKYETPPRWPLIRYGEWMKIDNEMIRFTMEELDPTNAFLSFRIGGSEIGADLEIRSFSFHRADNNDSSSSSSSQPPEALLVVL